MSKEAAMAMIKTGAPAPAVQTTAPATTTPGAAPATTSEAPATATPTDPRIQALLKKETTLVRERESFNKEKASYDERIKRADELLARGKTFEETLRKDPVEALKLIGLSDTQIFNVMAEANKEKPAKTPEEIAREETQRLLKERDDSDAKTREEQLKVANAQAVTTAITKLVTAPESAEKYEYINHHGPMGHEIVRETLFEFAKQLQGQDIDQATAEKLLAEAADSVEDWFEQQDLAMEKLKKREKRRTPAAPEPVVEQPRITTTVVTTPEQPKPKTLTNRVTATSAAASSRKETPTQKRERLIEELRRGDQRRA